MTSCLVLEQPGRWRLAAVVAIFLFATLPLLPSLWLMMFEDASGVDTSFWTGMQQALLLAGATLTVALAIGLPLGVLSALYEFPGRPLLLVLVALPILVPSLLWSLGVSVIAGRLVSSTAVFRLAACLHTFALGAMPLVLFAAYAATSGLSRAQVEAARMAGGERTVVGYACRNAALPALLVALLGAVLTLADPSPGQIFGIQTAATHILTSFAAQYDPALAGRQAARLTLLTVLLATPAVVASRQLSRTLLARQIQPFQRSNNRAFGLVAATMLAAFVVLGMGISLAGLLVPVVEQPLVLRPAELFRDHQGLALLGLIGAAMNTILYAVGSGVVATALGFALAVCVGREPMLRAVTVGVLLLMCCWPPAAAATGLAQLAARAPAWADPVLRSQLTVCLALGLRFFPIAALFALRTWATSSPSWTLAAVIHDVPLPDYVRRVLVPFVAPSALIALLLVGLLAAADVSTVLLLHPPGDASVPLAIFTVMANAPERTVAVMCLLYLFMATGFLWTGWHLVRRGSQ